MSCSKILQLQRSYSILKDRAREVSSPAELVYLFLDFFESAPRDLPDNWIEPYLLELIPELSANLRQIELDVVPLGTLHNLEETFARFVLIGPDGDISRIRRLLQVIRKHIAFLYLCVHEYEKCFSFVQKTFRENRCNASSILENERSMRSRCFLHQRNDRIERPCTNPPEWLKVVQEHLREHSPDLASPLEELAERWRKYFRGNGSNRIRVLFVEQGRWFVHGHLKDLFCAVDRMNGIHADDHLQINNSVPGYKDPLLHQGRDALSAVRRTLHEIGEERIAESSWNLSISIPEKQHVYTGDSLGLAMGTVMIASLLQKGRSRNTFLVNQKTAVTGALSPDGTCISVGEDGLAGKLTAAFYSPMEAVVVPYVNYRSAEEIVHGMKRKHPERNLRIIRADMLKNVIAHPSIVARQRKSLIAHTTGRIGRKVFRIAAVAFFLLLIVTCVLSWRKFVLSPVPERVAIFGQNVVATDYDGNEVWKFNLGYSPGVEVDNEIRENRYLLEDLDGDGHREVAIQLSNRRRGTPLEVLILDHRGRLKDERYQIGSEIILDEIIYSRYYSPCLIDAFDFDEDGIKEIVSITKHHGFPCRVDMIEPGHGIFGNYLHCGHIYEVAFIDITGNDIPEILLGATNCFYNQAVFIVLDSEYVSGASPSLGMREGFEEGSEMFYIRLPRCGWSLYRNINRETCREINVLSEERIETVVDVGGMYVTYHFDRKLNLVETRYPDKFHRAVEEVSRSGESIPFDGYSSEKALYWDGTEWVPTPVMNTHYLEMRSN
jgi:hypothetical protein